MKAKKTKRTVAFLMAVLMLMGTAVMGLTSLTTSADAASTTTQKFTDVTPGKWYYEAIMAMADAGIVQGSGNGKFRPNDPMTAGELATVYWNMLYGDICKAGELTAAFPADSYSSKYANYVVQAKHDDPLQQHISTLRSTTWDGAAAIAIFGDIYADKWNGERKSVTDVEVSQFSTWGRYVGQLYGSAQYNSNPDGDDALTYGRDMTGLAIVAMSKEKVTRGFAISELVNVLRETGNLAPMYQASKVKNNFPSGSSIADWAAVTNQYQDCCYATVKDMNKVNEILGVNDMVPYRLHYWNFAWDYVDYPGQTWIGGGYANTWFSADILLAFQCGLIQGRGNNACDVSKYMTRAEVCQMLYNAGVTNKNFGDKTTSLNKLSGPAVRHYRFLRDGKEYRIINMGRRPLSIRRFNDAYNPAVVRCFKNPTTYIYDYKAKTDIRQQEWPNYPQYWKFYDE